MRSAQIAHNGDARPKGIYFPFTMKGVAALNVYKKVAIIRRPTDSLTYEDSDGNLKTVTDLGDAASSAVSIQYN